MRRGIGGPDHHLISLFVPCETRALKRFASQRRPVNHRVGFAPAFGANILAVGNLTPRAESTRPFFACMIPALGEAHLCSAMAGLKCSLGKFRLLQVGQTTFIGYFMRGPQIFHTNAEQHQEIAVRGTPFSTVQRVPQVCCIKASSSIGGFQRREFQESRRQLSHIVG
jgi:hypothetical protein